MAQMRDGLGGRTKLDAMTQPGKPDGGAYSSFPFIAGVFVND